MTHRGSIHPDSARFDAPAAELPRILLVEDETDNREMYAAFLSNTAGHRVIELADGRHVFETIARERPDAVVLDLLLPDIDGFTICERIRGAQPPIADTPIVVVTGLAPLSAMQAQRLHDAPPDALFVKPCLPEALTRTIAGLLRRGQHLRTHAAAARTRAEALGRAAASLRQRSAVVQARARDLAGTSASLSLLAKVRREFEALPRLMLSCRQARRLWHADEMACARALDVLVQEGFLRCIPPGVYVRADYPSSTP